jgi:hypothetical protein
VAHQRKPEALVHGQQQGKPQLREDVRRQPQVDHALALVDLALLDQLAHHHQPTHQDRRVGQHDQGDDDVVEIAALEAERVAAHAKGQDKVQGRHQRRRQQHQPQRGPVAHQDVQAARGQDDELPQRRDWPALVARRGRGCLGGLGPVLADGARDVFLVGLVLAVALGPVLARAQLLVVQ